YTAVIIATAYTELLGPDAPQPDIADLLIKPFQRDRFALALERGRQWRKQALEGLTIVMARRVPATLEHGARVARYAVATAREMSLTPEAIDEIELAARF